MDSTRVVITGLGAISALGSSIDKLWDGLVNGRSGIRRGRLVERRVGKEGRYRGWPYK